MNKQKFFSILAISIGFSAAIFFCIGSISISTEAIIDLASPRWDYHSVYAKAIASQKAQYVIGGLLLVASFGLQIVVIQVSPASQINLPRLIAPFYRIVAATVLLTILLGFLGSRIIYKCQLTHIQNTKIELNRNKMIVPSSQIPGKKVNIR